MKLDKKVLACVALVVLGGSAAGMMGDGCDIGLGGFGGGGGGGGGQLLIDSVTPMQGHAGTLVTIEGSGFGEEWEDNYVMIGSVEANVVTASPTRIEALVGIGAENGPVSVDVGAVKAETPDAFLIMDWPSSDSGEDGPPIFIEGRGLGTALSFGKTKNSTSAILPSTGQLQVLVIPSYPTDRVPGNEAAELQAITDVWTEVNTFYDQASYDTLDVQITVANWVPLTGNFNDYVLLTGGSPPGEDDPWWTSNLRPAVMDRFRAECANGAVNSDNFDLDDFDVMACYIWINGARIRAWGGSTRSNFAYTGNGLDINITADHEIWQVALGEDADWGRCAHELGHCLIEAGTVLGEDVYRSGLVDPDAATAASFEMMGSHDSHPLYSGEYMYQLGWFDDANVVELEWDRNPSSEEFFITAHRLVEDNDPTQIHLVRIKVNEGLYYYVETRQRPPAGDAQIFDTAIPLGGASNGGVVVTKVITDEVNNNQQMRFVTLLHADSTVLDIADVATDPARGLRIIVDNVYIDTADDDRMVATVTVEWAQNLQPDPDGDFDLRIEPWGPNWETVDIWVDRSPWNVYDSTDAAGNPTGNGDVPQVEEINRFYARVHNDGDNDATNVRLTFYSIEPPGVGDNGSWTPIDTQEIATITAGDSATDRVNWVPIVDKHTCLQVIAEHQEGEVTYGNNKAQENVFEFEPAADSIPDPIKIPLAVRNPLDEATLVWLRVEGVPAGYKVMLPHHWVYLEAGGEMEMEAVVITLQDIEITQRALPNLIFSGGIPHSYGELVDDVYPASRVLPIGGFTAMIRPKHRVAIKIEEDRERTTSTAIGVRGDLTPGYADQPVTMILVGPQGSVWGKEAKSDANGAFSTVFDLTLDPEGETTDQIGQPASGDYKARAYTIGAPDVIRASAKEIIISFP